MDLLHMVLAFNLVTSIGILASCYALHRSFDTTVDGKPLAKFNVAGMSGVAVAVGLMSGVATMFV